MLEISGISKKYKTGDFIQTALDKVDLTLRDNEFVAILGPSGSGKTTLLNIIGGLDRYDAGDLIINGKSTKDYKDRDWDTYRNHTIGFVFQSYNLIPHQSVLENVALALTIGGISGAKRKEMALNALEKVGLSDHVHKRPNQLSGGQMQRVAIARALVNNPDIVLADEPTGALDTETGIQVMELLKEVARDRLVVMVTHNPELADEYATRIIKIQDGKIKEDSKPVSEAEKHLPEKDEGKKTKKAGMSFPTSFKLSLNNLRTKFGRTLLTAIAGSIGIIGIALILAMSNGVNDYIYNIQHDTMASYPLTINSSEFDMSQVLSSDGSFSVESSKGDRERQGLYANTADLSFGAGGAAYKKNNLSAFKKYLEDPESPIQEYIGENGVTYGYKTAFSVYSKDKDGNYVDTNDDPGDSTVANLRSIFAGDAFRSNRSASSAENFYEMTPGKDGELVSDLIKDSYDMVAGEWPSEATEVVVLVNDDNSMTAEQLYQLGVITKNEYDDMTERAKEGAKEEKLSDGYDLLLDRELYLVPQSRYYEKNENGTFGEKQADLLTINSFIEDSTRLRVSGIIKEKEDLSVSLINGFAGYTSALTDLVVAETDESEVVKAQEENPDVNVLTGVAFFAPDNAAKAADAKEYATNLSTADKASMYQMITVYRASQDESEDEEETAAIQARLQQQQMEAQMSGKPLSEEEMLAAALDAWLATDPKEEDMVKLYDNYIGSTSYDGNMESFGKVNKDAPSSINIYTDTFEDKDSMEQCIKDYNDSADEKDKITYNDIIGILTSSMTRIVNVITGVLIGFVSVSLVVSSIMIGIITHISVLERTKEIGILRAMGASKGNISQVFNAETILIGLASGLIGVGVAVALTFPMTAIMRNVMDGAENVRAFLHPLHGVILVILSMVITFIGGIIPSRKAAGKDPVAALRSE